ncbi:MAG: fimbrial protein [Caudoviricetes sp.]|nr:MAG: fimbrial protein [Caudoviricetes sp.]
MTIYRKVLCSERLPEKEGEYIAIDIDGYTQKSKYRFNSITYSPEFSISYVKYWLEEIYLGDLKFTKEDATPEFVDGINYILNKLK